MQADVDAAIALIESGALIPLRLISEEVRPSPDEGEFGMRLELSFEDDDSPEEDRADVAEWGAIAFLFVIGVLCFDDARPRGMSEAEYIEKDQFLVADLVEALRFRGDGLHLDTDYVRGRRMKTHVAVRPDGTTTIETLGRGKPALRWIERLQGRKPIRLVD